MDGDFRFPTEKMNQGDLIEHGRPGRSFDSQCSVSWSSNGPYEIEMKKCGKCHYS